MVFCDRTCFLGSCWNFSAEAISENRDLNRWTRINPGTNQSEKNITTYFRIISYLSWLTDVVASYHDCNCVMTQEKGAIIHETVFFFVCNFCSNSVAKPKFLKVREKFGFFSFLFSFLFDVWCHSNQEYFRCRSYLTHSLIQDWVSTWHSATPTARAKSISSTPSTVIIFFQTNELEKAYHEIRQR